MLTSLEPSVFLFAVYKHENYNTILPVALYGCETMSLPLRQEHRLSIFENKVLRIFGPRWDELTGGWIKLHNKKFHNLHF
jgi:hypothetical protein